MISLEEYEKGKREDFDRIQDTMNPHPNGIKCPQCEEELWDSRPGVALASYPPQKDIHCPKCGYKGYTLF